MTSKKSTAAPSIVIHDETSLVAKSLSELCAAVASLADMVDLPDATAASTVLATVGRCAAQFDARVSVLADHAPTLVDAANDVVDAAETLARRWTGLRASRRRALIEKLLSRQPAVDASLASLVRAEDAGLPRAGAVAPSPPRRERSGLGAKGAWDAWVQDPCRAARDAFMQESQSWIEGAAAQLARDERSANVERSSAGDVAGRVRHHLDLLAAQAGVSYLDALDTARRRVAEEMHTVPLAGS